MSLRLQAAAVVRGMCAAFASVALLAGGLGVLALPAPSASAQMFQMMAGGGPGGDGSISKRSVQLYGKILGFDKDQSDTLITLHEGYLAEHKVISEEMQGYMRKVQEEFQESQDFSIYQKEVPKKQREFAKRMETTQNAFLDDVKGLCTPTQEEKWPALERHRKRETYLRIPFIAGVSVDVVDCVRRVGMPPEEGKVTPEVKEALEQYEMTLDRKLGDVERMARDAEEKATEMAANFDFQKIQEMMKKFSDEAILIRNINRDNARRVSALLPEDARTKFDKEVQRRSYPRVYRKSYFTRAVESAEKFKDLDAEQKTTLADLKAGYEREAGPINEKWATAITEREDKEGSSFLSMMNFGAQPKDNPVTEARKARKELDGSYKEKLLAALKDDQKKQLPKEDALPPGANPQQMDMMEDFNFGGEEETPD